MLIGDFLSVWKQGKAVANPAAWKNSAATASALAALVSASLSIAAAFGYALPLDNAVIEQLAGGLAAVLFLFSGGVHITSSDKVGLPAKPDATGYSNGVGADPEAVRQFLNGR